MPFKAIAIAALIPPTSLVLFALYGLLMRRRYAQFGRWLTWVSLLVLLALSLPVVSENMLVSLERGLPMTPPADAPPQAIVILGGDVNRTEVQNTVVFSAGELSLERVRAGAALARQTGLPILVTGGPIHPGDAAVAAMMAISLIRDFQVPVQWVEMVSPDTWQNARMSATLLRQHGISSIYVVTQAWHMRRALLAFADTGLKVTAAPTHLDHAPTPIVGDFLPNVGAWRTAYFALHEWIGYAWYVLR